jgi:hypothetical protein
VRQSLAETNLDELYRYWRYLVDSAVEQVARGRWTEVPRPPGISAAGCPLHQTRITQLPPTGRAGACPAVRRYVHCYATKLRR